MRFFILYNKKSYRWQVNLLALAIQDSLRELGHEAVASSRLEHDVTDRKGVLLLIHHEAATVLDRWDGPVHIYNVIEAYVARRRWYSTFIRDTANWGKDGCDRRIDFVWDYSPNNTEFLERKVWDGSEWQYEVIPSVFCPMGYHPRFEIDGIPDKPVADVGFLGSIHHDSFRYYAFEALKKSGISMRSYIRQGEPLPRQYVTTRETLSCRIFLHTHAKTANFSAARVVQLGMTNRRFVIAEEAEWNPPGLTSGKHYVTYPRRDYKEMIRLCHRYKDRPDLCSEIAAHGAEFVRTQYRLVDHIRAALPTIERFS